MITLEQTIKNNIRDIPDFPKAGIIFKDITPLLLNPELTKEIVEALSHHAHDADAVCAIESRGFLFGLMLAEKLNVPFIPIRKKGKLPGETVSYAYELEYGTAEIEMHKEDLPPGSKVLIHDDLLATGGTAAASAELIRRVGSSIAGFSFLIELSFLDGRKILKPYSEHVDHLASY